MKAIYIFLFAWFFICPVQAQIKSDSLHVEMWKLTDLISQYNRNPTPELKAYFRSLRPVADEYWKTTVDSIDRSLRAMKTYDEFMTSGVDARRIMDTYRELLKGVVFSYQDTILNHPKIQALIERGREVIRKGGDTTQAWKIVRQGLDTLPRYQYSGQSDDSEVWRLGYECCALYNMLSMWCAYEFGRMVRERDGLIHGMTIIRDSIWIKE